MNFGSYLEELTLSEMFGFWLQERQDRGFTYSKKSSIAGKPDIIISDYPYLLKK